VPLLPFIAAFCASEEEKTKVADRATQNRKALKIRVADQTTGPPITPKRARGGRGGEHPCRRAT